MIKNNQIISSSDNSSKNDNPVFKLNFYSLVDEAIKIILGINYEFPLENIKTNVKEEQAYHKFIHMFFLPKLRQIITENKFYLKVAAIELKSRDKSILYNDLSTHYSEDSVIFLNEKLFEELRNDILNMVLIEFIDISDQGKNLNSYMSKQDKFYNDKLLCLKNFINYSKANNKNSANDYEYEVNLKFKDYILMVTDKKTSLIKQFNFWFEFFLPKVQIKISSVNYEYYLNGIDSENYQSIMNMNYSMNDKNLDLETIIKNKMFLLLADYEKKILEMQNNKFSVFNYTNYNNKKPEATLILINNGVWMEIFLNKLEDDFPGTLKNIYEYNPNEIPNVFYSHDNDITKNLNIELNKHLHQISSINNINTSINKINFNLSKKDNYNLFFNTNNLYHNILRIELFGKYSVHKLNNIIDKKHLNIQDSKSSKIKEVIFDIDNFQTYEYLTLIKEKEELIEYIKENAINIFTSLTKFITILNKDKLKSITLNVKRYNANSVLLLEIQEKFNEFMIELVKQSAIIKNINILFSNDLPNQEGANEIFSSMNSKNANNYYEDLIYSMPDLQEFDFEEKKKKFRLVLFDNAIKVKNNSIVDFNYFEYYQVNRITKLVIGYFSNINELNLFLGKIKLYELCNLEKIICFLKSNRKINDKSLTTFFKFKWPKQCLKSILLIFEKFTRTKTQENLNKKGGTLDESKTTITTTVNPLSMNKIFNSIIEANYFNVESYDVVEKLKLNKYHFDLGGTVVEKKPGDILSSKIKISIIKKKQSINTNTINTEMTITNNNDKNNKNNNSNNNTTVMQHSQNILLQTSQPTLNNIMDNNKKNNIKLFSEVNSINSNYRDSYMIDNNFNRNNYPLCNFVIINSETYLRYFLNHNLNTFLTEAFIFTLNNNKNKIKEKYNESETFKNSFVIKNKEKNKLVSLFICFNNNENKDFQKIVNTRLKYKRVNNYFNINSNRLPNIFDNIASFLNTRVIFYNDFKYSNKLFKKIIVD